MTSGFARLLAAGLLFLGVAAAEDYGTYGLGLVLEDLRTAPGWIQVQRVDVLPGRGSCDTIVQVDLSGQMPPVGNQGRQGSCTAWAVGYYHKTHTEWLEHGWDVSDPENQFSPAFIYNQINGGVDQGSSFSDAMQLMIDQGCGNMVDSPYRDWMFTNWPTDTGYVNALPYRALERHTIDLRDTSGVNAVRQRLVNGYTSTIGIAVYGNFDRISEHNNTYCVADRTGSNRGGHAVTIVGYCDTLATNDGPGAFRVVNSWGPGWGDSGYFWMSYVAVMDTGLSAQSAAYATDRVDYTSRLLARVRVTHGSREKVGMRFVVGPKAMPLHRWTLRPWRRAGYDRPFPENDLVFDLTDFDSLLVPGRADSLFFNCFDGLRDNIEGSIERFSVESADSGHIARSWDTPLVIPEGSWVGAYALILVPLAVEDDPGAGRIVGEPRPVPAVCWGSIRLKGNRTALVTDAGGRNVARLTPGDNPVGQLSPGVYFVRQKGEAATYKLLLQR